jgi:glucose-1-phosphate cytidylyltransferase
LKVVIFAGGLGTRLTEETQLKPKPLVEACGKPLLWHIMQNYSSYGFKEFVILVGYKGDMIREYFANFWMYKSDITFNLLSSDSHVHETRGMPWKVSIVETGINTSTGSRLAKIKNIINEDFLLTYGDGIADVDISKLIDFHYTNSSLVTLTAVQPPAKFGALKLNGHLVASFQEKMDNLESWVNGGFFVVNKDIFDIIPEFDNSFESDVLPILAAKNQLSAFKHLGFWQPVDTVRDLTKLEDAINLGLIKWT